MKRMVYVIGIPGSGKTTLMRGLAAGLMRNQVMTPVPHVVLGVQHRFRTVTLVEIGRDRAAFSGTDALAMGIQPKALAYVLQGPYSHFIAEGDRLGNAKFFDALMAAGVDLTIVHLSVSPEEAARRRQARGSLQNATWVKGRETKVMRLAFHYPVVRINGQARLTDQVGGVQAAAPWLEHG